MSTKKNKFQDIIKDKEKRSTFISGILVVLLLVATLVLVVGGIIKEEPLTTEPQNDIVDDMPEKNYE